MINVYKNALKLLGSHCDCKNGGIVQMSPSPYNSLYLYHHKYADYSVLHYDCKTPALKLLLTFMRLIKSYLSNKRF